MRKPEKKITHFSSLRPGAVLLLMAWFLLACPVWSGEGDLYAQMMRRYELVNDELQKVLYEVDCREAPEYPERLLSVRRNAELAIGGEVRATYAFSRAIWKDPGFSPALNAAGRGKSESRLGDLSVNTARLLFDARIGDRWRIFVDMDLHGDNGHRRIRRSINATVPGDPPQGYFLEEDKQLVTQAYLEFLKGGPSGFGFMVGRMKLPFGLWNRPNLHARSFMDAPDLTGSYLLSPQGWDGAARLPHASRFLDPAVSALINYEMRDIVRFEAALFQESDRIVSSSASGAVRYRSDSHAPRSWQVGFSLLPLEGWELSAHFRNRHSRSRGMGDWAGSPSRWDFSRNLASGAHNPTWDGALGQWSDTGDGVHAFGARANEQAFIVGLAVEIPNTNLNVQAEYAHGWNQGFNKYVNSDGVSLGLSCRLTPFLTLHAQGDWLHVKDRSWMGTDAHGGWTRDARNNHVYRSFIGMEYELARGLTLETGWQYEYWKAKSACGGVGGRRDERLNTATMIYMGSRFIF